MSVRRSVGPSVRRSICLSVRLSVPRYFQTTKNVISHVPMTTKFDKDQERVEDNSKMTSECWSVGPSVCLYIWCEKERKKVRKKMYNKWRWSSRILWTPQFLFQFLLGFRPISGAFPAFLLSQIFSFPTETFILFLPAHFQWFTGAVPQFVAVFQEHKLILFLKRIHEALGCVGDEHDLEWTT